MKKCTIQDLTPSFSGRYTKRQRRIKPGNSEGQKMIRAFYNFKGRRDKPRLIIV